MTNFFLLTMAALIATSTAGCISAVDSEDDTNVSDTDEEATDETTEAACAAGVHVYRDSYKNGPDRLFCVGNHPDLRQFKMNASHSWNDQISSDQSNCSSSRYVTFFDHINYQGMSWTTPCGWGNLSYFPGQNDHISSMRVGCRVGTQCTSDSECCSGVCEYAGAGQYYCKKPSGSFWDSK